MLFKIATLGSKSIIETKKYYRNEYIYEVIIQEGVEVIGGGAFSECSGISEFRLPNTLTEIGRYAFNGCSGLTNLRLPSTLTKIGSYAFGGCSELTSLGLPDTLTEIRDGTFSYCSGIIDLRLPDTLTKIGDDAFLSCLGLTELSLPDTLTEIGNCAFYECISLEVIYCSDKIAKLLTEDVISGSKYSVEEMRQRADPKVYLNRFYWNPGNNHKSFKYLNDTIKTLFLCALRNESSKFLPNMPDEMYRKILSMIEC